MARWLSIVLVLSCAGCALPHAQEFVVPLEPIFPDAEDSARPDAAADHLPANTDAAETSNSVDATDPQDCGAEDSVADAVGDDGVSSDAVLELDAGTFADRSARADAASDDAPTDAESAHDWNSYACGSAQIRCPDFEPPPALCQAGQCLASPSACGVSGSPDCRFCAADSDCVGYAAAGMSFNAQNGANAHPHCCSGVCSPAGDASNCGTCGNACPAGHACGWGSPLDLEVSCL